LGQEGKWELINGEPVQMMAGATRAHDRIVTNVIIALGARLRGGPCWPATDDLASRMVSGNVRRPDVTVDCGGGPKDLESAAPVVFFEVLSPSTRGIDQIKKPDEYRQVPTLKHFVLLDPIRPHAWVWSRNGDGEWSAVDAIGLEADIALTGFGFSVSLRDIYDGVALADE
jgi:Uma2 family endonuclease